MSFNTILVNIRPITENELDKLSCHLEAVGRFIRDLA